MFMADTLLVEYQQQIISTQKINFCSIFRFGYRPVRHDFQNFEMIWKFKKKVSYQLKCLREKGLILDESLIVLRTQNETHHKNMKSYFERKY